MTWKLFLARLRRYLFPWRQARRATRPPDRRKRVFDFDALEDRASMEPPMGMMASAVIGVGAGVYAVNLALVNTAQADYRAPEPVTPTEVSAGNGLISEAPPIQWGAAAVVLGEYPWSATEAEVAEGATGPALGRLPVEDLAADPLAGGLDAPAEPVARPLGTLGEAAEAPEHEGGGGGAESGGLLHPGSLGIAAASSGSLGGGSSAAPPAFSTPPGLEGSAAPFTFSGGVGLTGPGRQQPIGQTGSGASPLLDPVAGGGGEVQPIPPTVLGDFARLPVVFETNQGQTDGQVQFLARGSNYLGFLIGSGPVLELPRGGPANDDGTRTLDVVSFQHQGADTSAIVNGVGELTSRANYFSGDSAWIDIPQFASVRYQNFYPNIDLVYHAGVNDPTQVEYDYVVQPGGDPNAIQFTVLGAQSVSVDEQGSLVVTTPGGTLTDTVPAFSQTVDGVPQAVTGSYVLNGNTVGLQVTGYDSTQPLTIDPTLSLSTYLGGSGTDIGNGVAVDAAGSVYVTGSTTSSNFPGVSGTLQGTQDAFVTSVPLPESPAAFGAELSR